MSRLSGRRAHLRRPVLSFAFPIILISRSLETETVAPFFAENTLSKQHLIPHDLNMVIFSVRVIGVEG